MHVYTNNRISLHSVKLYKNFQLIFLPLNAQDSLIQYNLIVILTDMRPNIDLRRDLQGELYDQLATTSSHLRWSGLQSNVLLTGGSDLATLRSIKNVLLLLQQEFGSEDGGRITFDAQRKDDVSKRLLLLEGEVDGLLRRRINYSIGDQATGQRNLDFSGLLNQKQNQIVELQKKINNLEQRLRRSTARQVQLENHILFLTNQLKVKDNIINSKNQIILAEVASTNAMRECINRLKKNFEIHKSRIGDLDRIILEGVNIPEVGGFEIRADTLTKDGAQSRSRTHSDSSEDQKLKTKAIQLFREFERLFGQQNVNQEQVERILQGFLTELKGSRLYEDMETTQRRIKAEQDLKRLKQNFAAAATIYQQGVEQLKIDNPNIRINMERNIFDILQREKVQAYKTEKGAIFVSDFSQRTIQVPVQDARTKHLLHLFASELKRLFMKYPKLQTEINERVVEFFQQQIIDLIEVDQVDRLVEIVKYKPQVVKVENVYAYSSEKSRKVEFHLRVLIKALLQQLDKMKAKSGIIPQMDEGVVGMIKQQIMGVVNVDDILKVFRVVPKIVQVEKIVQKVVEKIVEVPTIVTVDRIVERIVEVEKIKQVDRIVNIPLDQPVVYDRTIEKIVPIENTVERVVEVPTIVERLVEIKKQVPNVIHVDRFEEKIVEVQKIVEVERVVNHIQKQYETVELIQQKIVPMEKIIQKIVQIPVIVEKIVEKVVEVPKIIEVEKIVEKMVPVVEYRNARQVLNHIEVQHQIVERIVEKPVPIIQTIERIVEVPQIVERIVQVVNIETRIVEKQVIREKIVIEEKIKEVEKIVTQIVEVVKQVPREIEKIIQIPVVHQRLVVTQQFIEKPIIQKIETTTIKQVYLRDPLVIKEPKIVEVEKVINHYIQVPKPFKYVEEKIIEVPRIVDRIKEVRVEVEKLVQKMVQVPKVVEVEKVVQKIVVVPRVIEKVIEIPQIVEKVVEKQVIKEVVREVEKRVEVLVYQDRPFEVEVQKNVFIEVEKIVEKIVDKLVEVPKFQQVVQIKQIVQQKVVQVVKQIPKVVEVEKIVTLFAQQLQLVEIEKPVITPIQVPVPVDRIVQKLVIKQDIVQRVVQVPQIVERIVAVREQETIVHEIQKVVEKIVVDQKIKEVERIVPYIQQVIKQIPTIVEKIVPVQSRVQQIVTAQQIIEKVIEKVVTVPKIYEVERLREVMVQVPKFIEIEKIVPQLVRVNNYIQKVAQKIVEIPIIIEQLKEVERQVEKVVKVQSNVKEVVEVEKVVQKIVVMEKMKEVVRNINHIEKVLEIIDRLEQLPPVQITAREEILVEVPYILEKIVEKIVVMPQIVEVLKYVHEITEVQQLGVAVDVQVSTYQQKYRSLSKNMKLELDVLLRELRAMRNPQWNARIQIIEKFLAEFDKFILNPRIIKVPQKQVVEKQIQVEKIVRVPTQDEKSLRMELTLSLLVQKLILELKRVRDVSKIDLQLDEDIKLIFFGELKTQSQLEGALAQQIQSYSGKVMRQFESLGSWSIDHQLMLNSFLQQRFLMAELVHNANLQIEKALETGEKRLEGLRKYKKDRAAFEGFLVQILQIVNGFNAEIKGQLGGIISILQQFQAYSPDSHIQPVRVVGQLLIEDQRIQSLLREKQQQIYRLKDLLTKSGLSIDGKSSGKNYVEQINKLRLENGELKAVIRSLQAKIGTSDIESHIAPFRIQIKELQEINLNLQSQISRERSNVINLKAENAVLRDQTGQKSRYLLDTLSIGGESGARQAGGNQNGGSQGGQLFVSTYGQGNQQLTGGMSSGAGGVGGQSSVQQTSGSYSQSAYGGYSQGGQTGGFNQSQSGVVGGGYGQSSQLSAQGSAYGVSSSAVRGVEGSQVGGSQISGSQARGTYGQGYSAGQIQGATLTTSAVKSGIAESGVRSPETYKQFQSPSTTMKMQQARFERSSDLGSASRYGTPGGVRQWKRQQTKKDESGKKY